MPPPPPPKNGPHITFYIDIVSPFAYIAFHILETTPLFASIPVTYRPILLGGIMRATKNQPPLTILNKAAYTNAHRLAMAARFNIPIAPTAPPKFPQSTLVIQRSLLALQDSLDDPELFKKAVAEFWGEYWGRGDNAVVEEGRDGALRVLAGVLGSGEDGDERKEEARRKAEEVVALGEGEDVKRRLKEATDECVALGAFGLPWMIAKDAEGRERGFFGVDHMGLMAEFLGLSRGGDGEGEGGEGIWKALL